MILGVSVAHAEVKQGSLGALKKVLIDAHFPLLISASGDGSGSYRYDDRFWTLEQRDGVARLAARRDVPVESLCETYHIGSTNSAGGINIDGDVKNSIIVNNSTVYGAQVAECLLHVAKADIKIPNQLYVRAKLQASDFWVRGYHGDLEIDLIDGDLWLENVGGRMQVRSTGNGDIRMRHFDGNARIGVHGNSDVKVRESRFDNLSIDVTGNADAVFGPGVESRNTQVIGDTDSVTFIR